MGMSSIHNEAHIRMYAEHRVDSSTHEERPILPERIIIHNERNTHVDEPNEADIDLVMRNVHASRTQAVEALRATNNDIVEAIMQLHTELGISVIQ